MAIHDLEIFVFVNQLSPYGRIHNLSQHKKPQPNGQMALIINLTGLDSSRTPIRLMINTICAFVRGLLGWGRRRISKYSDEIYIVIF